MSATFGVYLSIRIRHPSKTLPSGSNVRPLGIGDLKVVKQNLLRYEASEVAHVENVLKGQEKERLHSVKQRPKKR